MSDITFENMTATEWFFIRDRLNDDDVELRVSGFCEAFTTRVKMPNGDRYVIDDWDGEIMSVEKIIEVDDNENVDS